jgi:L-seryl-tRNA(Ser) seleniumtransferase
VGIYEELSVRRVINAAAAQTLLGGSLMPPPVLAAMNEAAGAFVHLPELHDRVGERLAALTHNEAACVSCGAAAGILMTVAACMTRDDLARVTQLPDTDGLERTEVIAFRSHHNGFLSAARETGATLIEVGGTVEEYRAAISNRTAAVLWFAGDFWGDDALPLGLTVEIAHERGVPAIVDAADQIPPVSALWRYTRDERADLAIFSGGKGLRGPQSSGLIVGRADLVRACRANAGPLHSIGRPAKVGKEELLGLLAAVEWSLALDVAEVDAGYDAIVSGWITGLSDIPGIEVHSTDRSHSGQPIPRAIVELKSPAERDEIIATLWEMSPRIAVLPEGERAVGLNPQGVAPNDAALVLQGLRTAILSRKSPALGGPAVAPA